MLKLFADVMLVRGYTRSLLQDVTRQTIDIIPNYLADFMLKYDGKITLDDIYEKYGQKHAETIQYSYEFLVRKDFIFDVPKNQVQFFKEIQTKSDYPFEAQSILMAISSFNIESIKKFVMKNLHSITRNIGLVIYDDIFNI